MRLKYRLPYLSSMGRVVPDNRREILAVAAAMVLVYAVFLAPEGLKVSSAEYSPATHDGWYMPSYTGGGFSKVGLPYTWGDGFFRVMVDSKSQDLNVEIETSGNVVALYVDGMEAYTFDPSERGVYYPNRYEFILKMKAPGRHLLAVETGGSKYAKHFSLGVIPNRPAKFALAALSALLIFLLSPLKRRQTVYGILKRESGVLAAFLVIVSFTYFVTSAYVNSSNDGSHFALISALAEDHSVEIKNYVMYTWGVDYNLKEGRYYSDRPPGTTYLALPFYLVAKALMDSGLAHLLSYGRNIGEVFVVFLPNLAGTLSVFLLYLLLRHFGFGFKASLATSAVFAFSTMSWFEATHLQSHAVSQAAIMLASYLAVTMKKNPQRLIPLSFALAVSSIVEIQNLLFVPLFAAYLAKTGRVDFRKAGSEPLRTVAVKAAVVFIAIYLTLIAYNWAAFDELTLKSNKYNPAFPDEASFAKSLSGNPASGVYRLLLWPGAGEGLFDWSKDIKNEIPGLAAVSPVFLLSLAGLPWLYRRFRPEALLFLAIVAAEILVVSLHTTILTRHISPVFALMFIPAAHIIDRALKAAARRDYVLAAVVILLALYSCARVYYSMNTYWGRDLSNATPFLEETPSYVLMAALACLLYALAGGYVMGKFQSYLKP